MLMTLTAWLLVILLCGLVFQSLSTDI